jgi:cytochrome c-type biogenesis protein CcmH/NrfG
VKQRHRFAKRLTLCVFALGVVLSLSGCQSNQAVQQPVFSPAEEQRFKDEQAKAQQQMKTLTNGMGQSLSKTPTSPVTDPATEWRKTHPRKRASLTTPKTTSPSTNQPQP